MQRKHIFYSASDLDEDSRSDVTSVDMTPSEAATVDCVNTMISAMCGCVTKTVEKNAKDVVVAGGASSDRMAAVLG